MPQKNHVIISQNIILLLGRNMEVILHHFLTYLIMVFKLIELLREPYRIDRIAGRQTGP